MNWASYLLQENIKRGLKGCLTPGCHGFELGMSHGIEHGCRQRRGGAETGGALHHEGEAEANQHHLELRRFRLTKDRLWAFLLRPFKLFEALLSSYLHHL